MSGLWRRLRLGSAQGSTSEDSHAGSTKNSREAKDLMMDLISQYNSSSQHLSGVPEVKQLVVSTALNKLFTSSHFSICTIDRVLEVLDRKGLRSPAYAQLHALHCVDYQDMPEELRTVLPHLVNEALKLTEVQATAATQVALKGIL